MREDTEERKKKRRKKKSKFGYYLYAVVVLLLTIINVTLAALLLTHVQSIQVSGAVNSEKSEIISWIKEDPLTTNSLYTLWKFKSGSYDLPIYLKDVNVSLKAPWKVKVKIAEKEIIGCIAEGKAYVYFDEEGLVLKKASEYDEKTPIIEGLKVKNTGQFQYLKVDNEKVFSYIVNITEEIEAHDLEPNRLVWEEDGMNLYFEDICVKLGKTNFDEKVEELPPILEKLEGKNGTLQMEHYTSDSTTISFQENTEES